MDGPAAALFSLSQGSNYPFEVATCMLHVLRDSECHCALPHVGSRCTLESIPPDDPPRATWQTGSHRMYCC